MFYLEHHRSWANRIVNSIPKIVNLSIVDDWHNTTYHLPGKRKMSPLVEDPRTLFISVGNISVFESSVLKSPLIEDFNFSAGTIMAGFEILAFPCNQFAGQEPGSNEEIQDTIDVNGKNTAPVYKF
ncbi:hypothetical protein NC653_037514 [Populus alba x Populus x berolinensis]|uniref:Uncharacterized protein n=1 Tax=Populus alba x Populus x berolinensis TaxID=444605 RepID=A0AAD6LEP1_9ROSI|nr:hypothetical protein NC653_037514 [Populus alba x Populus x berolinensis]